MDAGLAEAADIRTTHLGAGNVQVLTMDALDFSSDDLHDGLHITAGVSDIPWSLLTALRPGGTAVLP